ncbi:MAG: hypothetical protein KatS3mg002_1044 [Candidatus Woesearchaeota archaeon]|jgi:LL-H family phage holin|nr:MAG: hypothetical protein KatS3mg002_1044 [Candidatus Woesearchaeota archaeon]
MDLEFWSAFAQRFLEIVLPPLVALIAGYIVQQIRLLEAKIKNERPDLAYIISFLADSAVKSAEQANLAGYITDKRQYAFDYIKLQLEKQGIKIDPEIIYKEIERAVFDNLTKEKMRIKEEE